jgi:hypothetical protein
LSTTEIIQSLKTLDNNERLWVIEEATRMVRDALSQGVKTAVTARKERFRAAAERMKDYYATNEEVREWLEFDVEITDEHLPK